ncbi:hypothetical protein AABC73_29175 (plasmid) [Pseudomonas sp. G.S.17]|uniref:hypothetical protein n=1 Tax=Pseudomonas sp. G.S.17 TaxID=3137451 RepID=UPI00311CB53A
MKRLFAALCVAAALSGCGNSNEVKAKAIVDEVRKTWDSVMPFEPGHRQTGIVSMNKEFVVGCSAKLSEAINKFGELKMSFADTQVAKLESTAVLNKDVIRWANTCNELKHKQGW